MDNIRSRNEVSSNDKWKIELIYEDVDKFNEDLKQLDKELETLDNFKKDFLENSKNFKDFFIQDEITSRLLEKLAVYANCKNDEDKTNSIYQELNGKITNIFAKYEEITSSIVPQILKKDKKLIDEYVNREETLSSYKHFFDVVFAKKEHILNEEVEKVLASYTPVLTASSETASYLTDADLKFGTITNEKGESVELTEATYSRFIKSKDRSVRKEAFNRLLSTYGGVKNTLTSTYSQTVNNDTITANLKRYKSSLEMHLKHINVPTSLYDNLIKTVRDNLDVLYDYYALKKEVLNLDEFHLYDGYVKMTKDLEKEYTFSEAKELVLNALSILKEDYTSNLEKAFSEGWIDIYPNRGKRSGAYSTGSYDTMPYVLLNYTNTYNDVSTLAHELGHSMHTFLSNKSNHYINASYPIFLAEIASTTNELLLSNYMYLNSTNKDEKLNILNEKLDLFKATIYRQTMFAEFEKNAHKYVEDNEILTSDYLCNMYYDLNKTYFGDGVVVDDNIKYEWLRIPHFYTPFYVYQYATSLSISCYIAQNIINKTPGFVDKYIKLLSSGGKDYPLELLKMIDIDLTDEKVFVSAINLFRETLEEFKKVYYEK